MPYEVFIKRNCGLSYGIPNLFYLVNWDRMDIGKCINEDFSNCEKGYILDIQKVSIQGNNYTRSTVKLKYFVSMKMKYTILCL